MSNKKDVEMESMDAELDEFTEMFHSSTKQKNNSNKKSVANVEGGDELGDVEMLSEGLFKVPAVPSANSRKQIGKSQKNNNQVSAFFRDDASMSDMGSMSSSGSSILSTKEPTEMAQMIRMRFEQYFSDINIARDKDLQSRINKSRDGWVELKHLLDLESFSSLNCGTRLMSRLLRKCGSKVIEVNESGSAVRRSPKMPAKKVDLSGVSTQVFYAFGFPSDTSVEEVVNYLGKRDTLFRHSRIEKCEKRWGDKLEKVPAFAIWFSSDFDVLDLKTKLANGSLMCMFKGDHKIEFVPRDYFRAVQTVRLTTRPHKKFEYKKAGVLKLVNLDEERWSQESLTKLFSTLDSSTLVYFDSSNLEAIVRFADVEKKKQALPLCQEEGLEIEKFTNVDDLNAAVKKLKKAEIEFFAQQLMDMSLKERAKKKKGSEESRYAKQMRRGEEKFSKRKPNKRPTVMGPHKYHQASKKNKSGGPKTPAVTRARPFHVDMNFG